MANTHDQIYYNKNISNPGGHIQRSIQFKYVAYIRLDKHRIVMDLDRFTVYT